MIQYSIRPKRSAIRAQAVYFLHSTMPSVTRLRLSNVRVICRVTYFQFPIQSAFLQCIGRQAAPALLVLIRNIRHRTLKWMSAKSVVSEPLLFSTLVSTLRSQWMFGCSGNSRWRRRWKTGFRSSTRTWARDR